MKLLERLKRIRSEFYILGTGLLILSTLLAYEFQITNGQLGAPLDDVYIHFQFSKNIVNGNGFSYNPGDPTPGSTSPAWTILISAFYLLIKNHLLIAKTLSAVFYLLTGVMTYKLANRLTRSKLSGFITAIFTLLTGRFIWASLSGMEVTLFTFLLLSFLYLHISKRNKYLQVLALGLASTVRPEAYLFYVFFLFLEFIQFIKSAHNQKKSALIKFKELVFCGFIYSLIVAPYLIFSYKSTGSFLPNTFRSQDIVIYHSFGEKLSSVFLYLFRYGYLLLVDYFPLLVFLPIGLWKLLRKGNQSVLLVFILVGFPIVAAFFAPNLRHHGRYTMPFVPLYILICIIGIETITGRLKKAATKIKVITVAVTLIYLLFMANIWVRTFGINVKEISDMQVKLGDWVSRNTEREDLIALNDIGAITYISDRKIIDMMGLVSPEIFETRIVESREEREEALWNLMKERNVQYVIIFPSWFTYISKKDQLEEVYRVEFDEYTMVDDKMIVYKMRD
ncbi:MAG: DUF2079 domain-containing protein [Candidatus Dojkabacteria bacterium]|nr:DUF2079 domain-containing protein [Candidatus Dojkabacteria bacterium]